MRIPKGRLKKITGFMVETEQGKIVFALNEVDFAYSDENGFIPRIFTNDKARSIYNELYKMFPK